MSETEKRIERNGAVFMPGYGPDIEIESLTAYVHAADEGGYWAEVPALPGCLTQGETLDEVVENLNDAIQGWLSVQTRDSLIAKGVPFSDVAALTFGIIKAPNRKHSIREGDFSWRPRH